MQPLQLEHRGAVLLAEGPHLAAFPADVHSATELPVTLDCFEPKLRSAASNLDAI
jgi:hypothetical protein